MQIWKHLEFSALASELNTLLRKSVDFKRDRIFVLDWLARIERELDINWLLWRKDASLKVVNKPDTRLVQTLNAAHTHNWRQSLTFVSVHSMQSNSPMYTELNKQVTWLPSPRSEAQAHVCLPVRGAPWWVLLQHSIMLRLFFIAECAIARFLCAMRVFEVWASSSSPRLPFCHILFLSRSPLLS